MEEFINVGKRITKIDAEEKVTGKAVYIQDLKIPGMLHGKILYSSHPHAKIKSIDTSKAEKLPGVKAILTGYNIPPVRFGVYKDNVTLKANKVCSLRDEIAAVAATDPDIAEEALNLIRKEPLSSMKNTSGVRRRNQPMSSTFPGGSLQEMWRKREKTLLMWLRIVSKSHGLLTAAWEQVDV